MVGRKRNPYQSAFVCRDKQSKRKPSVAWPGAPPVTAERLCGDQRICRVAQSGPGQGGRVTPIIVLSRGAAKKGAHSLAPSPFAATPQVRQGHGPPGHGASGSRAVRAFASHRRLEWDNRGGGFGSRYGGHQCW
ncbi:hypothetical protein V8C43DRAFT_281824 [Trichoderma afarasin]